MTLDEAFAELAQLTKMTAQEWRDFCSLDADAQLVVVQAYRDQDWTQSPDTMGKVLAILGVIGTVAGVVSGVAGAAGAVTALKTIL